MTAADLARLALERGGTAYGVRPPEGVAVTEAAFLGQVLDLARLYSWRCFHPRPGLNRRGKWSTPTQGHCGFPDIVLARLDPDGRARLILAELKADAGRLSRDQEAWGQVLRAVGGRVSYEVWKPGNWSAIVEALRY
jgi:hypothetical protein